MSEDALRAFEGLADETRMAILVALVEARRENPESPALSFSELRSRAGVDDSGRFNYHLGKLAGRFLSKTDEGYELNVAGRNVAAAIASGVYVDYDPDPETLEENCPVCGSVVVADFEDGAIEVACDGDDEHLLFGADFPAGAAVDRTIHEVIELATREVVHEFEFAVEGVCPDCYCEMAGAVEVARVASDDVDVFEAACRGCGKFVRSPVGGCLLANPTVLAFYRDHGVELGAGAVWTLDVFDLTKWTRTAEDPVELRFETERDGERLSVTLDDGGQVIALTRE